jgi:hypothetical protein
MTILWGHQRAVYQLATSHGTLVEITSHSIRYCKLFKGIFKTKSYQEPLASFIEVGQFECFDATIIVRDRGVEYGLEGRICNMTQHEKEEVLSSD